MNSSVYFLKSLEDVVGNLSEVGEIDGHPIATIGGVTVAIPEDLAGKLQGLVGSRIGVLRDDQGSYRLKTGRH